MQPITLRAKMSDQEKYYIVENIFKPMDGSCAKITVFGTLDRAMLMLQRQLETLQFDRKQYQARIANYVNQQNTGYVVRVEVKRFDCEEIVGLDTSVTFR